MISSMANPQIKQLTALQTKTKTRQETGLFVVEGIKMVCEVPKAWLVKVMYQKAFSKAAGSLQRILTDALRQLQIKYLRKYRRRRHLRAFLQLSGKRVMI